jgi:uncharacterized OB-fold protein
MSERWFPNSMPNPMVDHYSLPWWQAAAEHRLQVQCCDNCGHGMLPPAPICSECRSSQLTMKDVNGKGSLYTYTVVHQPVSMEQEMPFVIAIVELDTKGVSNNTVRMMSNIVGASVEPTDIGRAVSVAWEDMSEEVCVPRFRFDS